VQLLAECRRPEPDIDRICELVSHDPALSAKIVGIANSPVYRRGSPVTSVRRATVVLGTGAVTALALSFSLVSQRNGRGSFDYAQYWRRALLNAVASRALALERGMDAEEAFLAGLLQDIGILALHAAVPNYPEVLRESKHDHLRLERIEAERFGAGHPEVGAWLGRDWGLPDALIDSVAGSHVPDVLGEKHNSTLPRCVAVSGYVASVWLRSTDDHVAESAAQAASRWLSLRGKEFEEVLVRTANAAHGFADIFEVTLPSAAEMEGILRQARDTLVQVTLRAALVASSSKADVQRLSAEKKTLEQHFSRDSLTRLFARAHMDAALAQTYEDAVRFGQPLSLLFCDIDHFKKVNDTYGHATGDKVLVAVARAIETSARQLDVVGRYGGEEFVMVLPDTQSKGAMVVAERIRASVEGLAFSIGNDHPMRVTISVGVATHGEAWMSGNVGDLLAAADAALYAAKRGGRNRSVAHQS
jgi:diguanylate cyclase (GGDEF)-like protein